MDDIHPFTIVQTLAGNAFVSSSGQWMTMGGTNVVCMDRRGSLEYNFTVTDSLSRQFEVELQPIGNVTGLNVTIPVDVLLDGIFIGSFTMKSFNGEVSKITGIIPILQPGSHTLRIINRNPAADKTLQITAIRILKPEGVDADNDGVADWATARIAAENAVSPLPAESYTSPVCVEGKSRFPALVSLVSGSNLYSVLEQGNSQWYADVPLNADGTATGIETLFTGEGVSGTNSVTWKAYNVQEANNTSIKIRKGDSLRLTAFPVGTEPAGTVELVIRSGTTVIETISTTADQPALHQFAASGTYTIQATCNASPVAVCTVVVKAASFGNTLWTSVNNSRSWSLPSIDAQLILGWDKSLNLTESATPSSGGHLVQVCPDTMGVHYVTARLYDGGPILARGAVQTSRIYDASDTGDTHVITTYDNGDQLVAFTIVGDNLPPGGYIEVRIFVSGITFEDGTTVKRIYAADLDANGVATLRFNYPANQPTGVCHHLYLFDSNGIQLGVTH